MCAARTQEEGLRRVQELKAEISSLEESRKTEKETYEKLMEEHNALTKQLEEEKVILLILFIFTANNSFYIQLQVKKSSILGLRYKRRVQNNKVVDPNYMYDN